MNLIITYLQVGAAGKYGAPREQYQNWPAGFGIAAFLILLYIVVRVIWQAHQRPDEWVEDDD